MARQRTVIEDIQYKQGFYSLGGLVIEIGFFLVFVGRVNG